MANLKNNLLELGTKLQISKELVKFIVAGVVNNALTYLTYLLLLLVVSYQQAFLVTFILGILISYYLNSKFTFRRILTLNKFFFFSLLYVAQYLVSAYFLRLLIDDWSFSKAVAPLVILVINVPLSFLLVRLIIKAKSITLRAKTNP